MAQFHLATLAPTLDGNKTSFCKALAKKSSETAREEQQTFHCNLAAVYGKLTKLEEVKTMDEKMNVMVGVTTRAITELTDFTWENVVACMMQNPVLKPIQESSISRCKNFAINTFNVFKIDGSPDDAAVTEVRNWFRELIQDEDILQDMAIEIDTMANIVAQTGASVTGPLSLLAKNEYEKKDFIDVGILRYSDIGSSFFKLYRIRLSAWRDCRRVLMAQEDTNGIRGDFYCMKFMARDAFIAKLSLEIKAKAIAEAEALVAKIQENTEK